MRLIFVLRVSLALLAALDAVAANPIDLQLPSVIPIPGLSSSATPTATTTTPPAPSATLDPANADINACAQYCGYTAVAPNLYFCGVTEAPLACICRSKSLRSAFEDCVVAQCPDFETRIDSRQTGLCSSLAAQAKAENQTAAASADGTQLGADSTNPYNSASLGITPPVHFAGVLFSLILFVASVL